MDDTTCKVIENTMSCIWAERNRYF